METELIKIDSTAFGWDKQLDHAAEILKSGGLVAFPTETVYGLGANALDADSVDKIFKAKGRPADNPLIIHIADKKALRTLVSGIPRIAIPLMEAFWPGPLTLIMPKSENVPAAITAGLNTVAVRMPSHPIALSLIRKSGVPVAAPSANSSGKPSPTSANHVMEDLNGKIDVIIDGGNTEVGLESTVLDLTSDPPIILRPGGVTIEELIPILGSVNTDPLAACIYTNSTNPPRSPGMKYRHYAPEASLLVIQGSPENTAAEINRRAKLYIEEETPVGLLITDETAGLYEEHLYTSCKVLSLGSRKHPETLASNLFRCLREFDEKQVDVILAEAPEEEGIGSAVMNRMVKAAGGNIIKV